MKAGWSLSNMDDTRVQSRLIILQTFRVFNCISLEWDQALIEAIGLSHSKPQQ